MNCNIRYLLNVTRVVVAPAQVISRGVGQNFD